MGLVGALALRVCDIALVDFLEANDGPCEGHLKAALRVRHINTRPGNAYARGQKVAKRSPAAKIRPRFGADGRSCLRFSQKSSILG